MRTVTALALIVCHFQWAQAAEETEQSTYRVIVSTGHLYRSGTDADVYLTIAGDAGQTKEILLDNAENNFEQYAIDVFEVKETDVGKFKNIRIRHTNTGRGPGWFLVSVRIDNLSKKQCKLFPCGRWLAKDEDDGKIDRTLTPR